MATFQSVQYVDPFAPLPTGATQAGVQAVLTSPPGGTVAYAQLLADQTPIGYGAGSTGTNVRVLNTLPLATGVAYQLGVQFAAAGQNPADLDWSNPANVISAPVVVQQPRITALSVISTGVNVSWDVPAGVSIAGAFVQLVNLTNNSLIAGYYLGSSQSASFAATFTAGQQYGVRVSGVQPVSGGTTGNFAAPYTIGPPSAPQPIPTAAPTLSLVSCSEDSVSAQWIAPAAVPNSAQPRYELVLVNGGTVVASAVAGPSGGQLATGDLRTLGSPQVGTRMSYGSFVGPVGTLAALFPLAPQIQSASVSGSSPATITAQLANAGTLPAGGALVATLYSNGVAGPTQQLSAASGSVSWTGVAVTPGVGYSIDVALQVSAGGVQSNGTPSSQLATPVTAPTALVAAYDGQQVSIDLTFPTGESVTGYQVTLTGSTGGNYVAQAGGQLPITFAANLDLSQTWTAVVTPTIGILAVRSASATVVLPVVLGPSLTSVSYDGAELSLQWSAASLPFISGYRIAVVGGPSLVTGAQQTSCVLPLTPAQASAASVTVTGLSTLRNTAASTAVTVLSSVVEIGSVVVGSNVVATWTVAPAPPAVQASLLIGDSVTATVAGATTTGVSFALPTPAGQPYRLQARAISADGISLGPVCAPVELILSAPSIESGDLGDSGQLSLRWNPVNPFGVTGYRLLATPTTGNPASLQVSGDGYDGPAPAAFSAPGTLSITGVNARCTGPAASAAIHAAGAVTTGSYADSQLTLSAILAGASATDTSWLEVLVNGTVAARQVILGTGSASYTVPVALPAGTSATARVSVVGPSTLAPASAAVAVPTSVPTMLSAAYDGSNLQVAWQPTRQAGVTGYLVSVAGAVVPDLYVPGVATATAAVPATLSYPFPAGLEVCVRAVAGAPGSTPSVTGQPSPGVAPTLAGYSYSAAVAEAGNPPYLYRRGTYQALAEVTGKPIVIYLAKPFSIAGNPTVPASGSPIFQLSPAPDGSQLPYQLTLSAEVWTSLGATPVRTAVHDSYVQFLSDVEGQGVFAWSINLIRQLIAEAMPQTFEEVPFYRYGYWRSDSMRVVDLMPGTRLQLSNALYQAVVGGTSEKNGFVALGTETMDIVEAIPQGGAGTLPAGAGRILSLDAFLSLVYPGGGSGTAGRPVAAGPLDFFDAQNRQSYYRLFYPTSFPASGSNGSTALTSNIALVGTTSWAALSTITQQYASTGTFPSGIDYFATYFRGRAGLTPLVNVTVQGESRWTPLGTSVRQALVSLGLAPYYGGDGGDALAMLRPSANLFGYPTPGAGLALDPVNLTNTDLGGLTPLYWPLDMPLVGGDQVGLRQVAPGPLA
ncbi:MAG: hypothetical protein M3Y42_06065 [Actinomycetota bacterium]|nr:hypothetical protein [Actinomycetota bacterium]MDQ2956510.1 hypothetical protein [Actinomycetota bacterium]